MSFRSLLCFFILVVPVALSIGLHFLLQWANTLYLPAANRPSSSSESAALTFLSEDSHTLPEYDSLKDVFVRQLKEGQAWGAQFAVYEGSKLVVNLAGGSLSDSPSAGAYTTSTVQNIFSCGKSIEALVLAYLLSLPSAASRFPLGLSTPLSSPELWPQFDDIDDNKTQVTLRDLLRHEGGVAWLKRPLQLQELLNNEEKLDRLAKLIEESPHTHGGEPNVRVYHGLIRGFVLNEVVRRVDRLHRTIDVVLRDDLLAPLSLTEEISVGLPLDREQRVADIVPFNFKKFVAAALLGGFNLTSTHGRIDEVSLESFKAAQDKTTDFFKGTVNSVDLDDAFFDSTVTSEFNGRVFRSGLISSANIHSTARAAASLFTLLTVPNADPGADFALRFFPGVSDETLRVSSFANNYDRAFFQNTTFTDGGWAVFDESTMLSVCRQYGYKFDGVQYDDSVVAPPCYLDTIPDLSTVRFYGWTGAGGTIYWFEPKLGITLAYFTNTMQSFEMLNPRPRELLTEYLKLRAKSERHSVSQSDLLL